MNQNWLNFLYPISNHTKIDDKLTFGHIDSVPKILLVTQKNNTFFLTFRKFFRNFRVDSCFLKTGTKHDRPRYKQLRCKQLMQGKTTKTLQLRQVLTNAKLREQK